MSRFTELEQTINSLREIRNELGRYSPTIQASALLVGQLVEGLAVLDEQLKEKVEELKQWQAKLKDQEDEQEEQEPDKDPGEPETKERLVWFWNGTTKTEAVKWNNWVRDRAANPEHNNVAFPGSGQRVYCHKKEDPPMISHDGDYLIGISNKLTREFHGHTEFGIRSELLLEKAMLKWGHSYVFDFEMRIPSSVKRQEYTIGFQGWGPTYAERTGSRNPSLAAMAYKGKWKIQCFGSPRHEDQSDWINYSKSFALVDTQWHKWSILFRPHHEVGLMTCHFDERLVASASGPVGLWNPGLLGPNIKLGGYSNRTKIDSVCQLRNLKFVELTA